MEEFAHANTREEQDILEGFKNLFIYSGDIENIIDEEIDNIKKRLNVHTLNDIINNYDKLNDDELEYLKKKLLTKNIIKKNGIEKIKNIVGKIDSLLIDRNIKEILNKLNVNLFEKKEPFNYAIFDKLNKNELEILKKYIEDVNVSNKIKDVQGLNVYDNIIDKINYLLFDKTFSGNPIEFYGLSDYEKNKIEEIYKLLNIKDIQDKNDFYKIQYDNIKRLFENNNIDINDLKTLRKVIKNLFGYYDPVLLQTKINFIDELIREGEEIEEYMGKKLKDIYEEPNIEPSDQPISHEEFARANTQEEGSKPTYEEGSKPTYEEGSKLTYEEGSKPTYEEVTKKEVTKDIKNAVDDGSLTKKEASGILNWISKHWKFLKMDIPTLEKEAKEIDKEEIKKLLKESRFIRLFSSIGNLFFDVRKSLEKKGLNAEEIEQALVRRGIGYTLASVISVIAVGLTIAHISAKKTIKHLLHKNKH